MRNEPVETRESLVSGVAVLGVGAGWPSFGQLIESLISKSPRSRENRDTTFVFL